MSPYAWCCRFILLSFCLVLSQCQGEIASGIARVNTLLYQQDYIEAEILLTKLKAQIERAGPKRSASEEEQRLIILDRLGKVYAIYLRNYKKAIDHYELLIRDYPTTNEAFRARKVLADLYHYKLDNIEAAISQYRKILEDFPKKSEAPEMQLGLVRLYIENKDFAQARSDVQTFLNMWPNHKLGLHAEFQIGMTYYLENRYSEAITSFEELLAKATKDPDLSALISFELGNSYEAIDQPQKALEQFYACLAKHPNPLLVQRRIRRTRKRIRQVRPATQIYSQYTAPASPAPAATPAAPAAEPSKETTASPIPAIEVAPEPEKKPAEQAPAEAAPAEKPQAEPEPKATPTEPAAKQPEESAPGN
ncbi:MAG: hypothetical protein CMH60_07925 [Myxococcales bacterium]|nr:hypothetical protein [Myxococcales bacterium]